MSEHTAEAVSKAQSSPIALFVSDVHLQAALPRTTQAFLAFLERHAARTERLYLLGDLFEYWAGDDDIADSFNTTIVNAIRAVSNAGVAVYWVGGNRDFLVGRGFAQAAGLHLLDEPHVTELAGKRIVLVHGDAQCTDDQGYMAFRAQVRRPEWQEAFLAQSLTQRKAIIDGMRTGSREAQRSKSYEIMDVNADAITALFRETGASVMIHGHTHRPATHVHTVDGRRSTRHVLPDWECDVEPARGGWLALDAAGTFHWMRFDGQPGR